MAKTANLSKSQMVMFVLVYFFMMLSLSGYMSCVALLLGFQRCCCFLWCMRCVLLCMFLVVVDGVVVVFSLFCRCRCLFSISFDDVVGVRPHPLLGILVFLC